MDTDPILTPETRTKNRHETRRILVAGRWIPIKLALALAREESLVSNRYSLGAIDPRE